MSTLYGMQRLQTITSAANPLLKDVRRAIARNDLTDDGLCIAEGFHLLDEALCAGREIPAVLAAESAQSKLGHVNTRLVTVPDPLFQSITTTETTQGVIALVRPAAWTLEQIFHGTSLVVVLDALQDPGNAGAIVRAVEAFGATGVLFLKGTASPYNPKTLRASAGSLFRVPFVAALDTQQARTTLLKHKVAIYAAMPYTGTQKLAGATDFVRTCALIAGSEGRGVSKELRGIAEEVAIPTTGVESLNTAVATAVLLYEARRQRNDAK